MKSWGLHQHGVLQTCRRTTFPSSHLSTGCHHDDIEMTSRLHHDDIVMTLGGHHDDII